MIFYYLMRDVEPGALCSYRPGRTYIDEVYRTAEEAERQAEKYNRFCSVVGVRYVAVPHRDDTPLPCEWFEPKGPIKHERALVG